MKKFRVGFLIDKLQSNYQIYDLINSIESNEHFTSPIIITCCKDKNYKPFFQRLINKFCKNPIMLLNSLLKIILMKIITKIELRIVLKKFPKYQFIFNQKLLNKFDTLCVSGAFSKSDKYLEFNDQDLALINQQHTDCIIYSGSKILKGNILNSSKFGVISFQLENKLKNNNGPSGFWEVFNGEPSSGFVIEKLNQKLDRREVFCRGNLMTSNLWLVNQVQLSEKCNSFLMRFLINLSINRRFPKLLGSRSDLYKNYDLDSCIILFRYLLKIIIPKLTNFFLSIFFSPRVTRYSVAYAYHHNHSKSLSQYKEISNPKGRFLADPFVFKYNDSNYIFVEDFFFKDNKGRISVLKINADKQEFLDVIIEEDFHLSFPYVFKDDNKVYMIPESHENQDIRLYKCTDFPKKWELEKVLMSNVSAVDTILLKRDDTWFMLTNICSSNAIDHSELHIFYSDNLKSDFWKPIASGNPVIFDPLMGRNGGLFYHNKKTFRVNQVHGQAHYGKSFNVNEIILLSKNNYIEKKISKVNANFINDIIATHHFSANESLAAIDFTRHQRLKKVLKN